MSDLPTNIKQERAVNDQLQQVCKAFQIKGTYEGYEEIKVGNVNRTYRVKFAGLDSMPKYYIVQAVNTFVFNKPEEVMDNIDKVTRHIQAKIPGRTALRYYHTADHKTYLFDQEGFWRLFNFIPSITYNTTDNLDVIRSAGEAFGEFQMLLSDFAASQLYETIPHFHNTKKRYEKLMADAADDPCGKVSEVRDELDWLMSVKATACSLTDMHAGGELPLRVTHNDTKINNVLFDPQTDRALVVIDLDTVMPGLVGHDFGDAIRFAANFVEEDSPEYEKAGVNMDVFHAFTEGFLKHTAGTLMDKEIDTLALSSFVLAVELATRFLDDYILGSPYFHIAYPEHNLVRARCQIALAKDMLKKMDEMNRIVKACAEKHR